ncbi:MAG: hypothetical protein K2X10_08020, partial [Hyphomicrobiales bacterium]|nr:hypothetical protein [Hyphomicrobiales bacterium]
LPMVNVTDRPDIAVRLVAFKLRLAHDASLRGERGISRARLGGFLSERKGFAQSRMRLTLSRG